MAESDLQSKVDRPYFTESIKLARGEVFSSPFDLNIEHNQLEFSSVVKFIEELFHLPFLTARDSGSADMWDAFNFSGPPQPPLVLPLQTCEDSD